MNKELTKFLYEGIIEDFLAEFGIDWKSLNQKEQLEVLEGIAEGFIEEYKDFMQGGIVNE